MASNDDLFRRGFTSTTSLTPSYRVTTTNNLITDVEYDFVQQTQTSTTDTWTFKTGGSGGTTVAVILITYTDSTKETIDTVERTT